MKINILSFALRLRAILTKIVKPKSSYRLAPISDKYGFDRGTPIDRYWIEKFLRENKQLIFGRVLEITDNKYTLMFGSKVTKSDVLDINPKNKRANIVQDLKNMKSIKSDTYDCIVLTQVLGMIDNLPAAVSELHRVLKPGGKLLITSSCMAPAHDIDSSYWRFTKASMKYLFSKKFHIQVNTYGNALAGQAFWVGLAQEELTNKELDHNDPRYPCIVTLIAEKK